MAVNRRLRYSERKQLAESGSLGDLVHDRVPASLVSATLHFAGKAKKAADGVGGRFSVALSDACIRHWGAAIADGPHARANLMEPDTYLDYVEILIGEATVPRMRHSEYAARPAWKEAESEFNALWERHRFGFVLVNGEARRVGSPALQEVAVGPALLAARRDGWGEVEKSYREAVLHQRGPADENDDALTAAHAAVEAALKAAGLSGSHLGPLANSFKQSNLAHPQLGEVPDLLNKLLQRIGAVRNEFGDSHGKHDGADVVPQELVDLAIHWAGSFIVYLSARTA